MLRQEATQGDFARQNRKKGKHHVSKWIIYIPV